MKIYLIPYIDRYTYFMITKAKHVSTIAYNCKSIFFNSKSDQTTGNMSINTEYLLDNYNYLFTGITGAQYCFYDIDIKFYN